MKTMLTFVAILTTACGGKPTPASSDPGASATATPGAGEHGGGHASKGEHANMGAEMTRFHDVLAPRWHAAKGPQRVTDTCASVPDFKTNAAALASSAAPGSTDTASWSTATKELTVAVSGLEAACKSSPKDFEAAFERVHTVFHAVMELGNTAGGESGAEHSHKL